MSKRTLVATFALAAAIGCGGEGPRVPEGGPSLGAPTVPWPDKTEEERMAFMAAHVQPKMEALFREHDADYYPSLECTGCHGENMEARDYAMPSDELYSLPKDDPIGDAEDYDEEVAEFMKTKVVPTMTKLLALEPKEPGEACFLCHPTAE